MDRTERHQSTLQTWAQLETLHDLTYFSKESRQAYKDLGVADPWARYFAGRSAPMGRVEAGVVTAAFYSFSHTMVEAAIPSVWEISPPAQFIEARFRGFHATWERIAKDSPLAPSSDAIARAAELAMKAAMNGERGGHPLYAANLAIESPTDAVSQLFHAATLIREYRGDCHNLLLGANGISGCQAHILMVAIGAEDRSVGQGSRGYTDQEWDQGAHDLRERGMLDKDQSITPSGRSFRAAIERNTNLLMQPVFDSLSHAELSELGALSAPIALAVNLSGTLPKFTRAFELLAETEG
jgi:hypothetical protein